MDLLRIVTAGSVDDGKSTLIGRLLLDSKSLDDDVLSSVEGASRQQRSDYVNLALITDGLRAEREQGITIDVAYRYFSTAKRKFILADTPGHFQYTRNMVTGASNADVALIMVDARHGMVEQSRRHSVIAALLGIEHIVVCINKMDLVGHERHVYEAIRSDFIHLMARLGVGDVEYIPTSALYGDNIVEPSSTMPWFTGQPLLHHLEQVPLRSNLDLLPFRLPVQHAVASPPEAFHRYIDCSGSIASGLINRGDRVSLQPNGGETTILAIETPWGPVEEAGAPDAVTVRVHGDLDISRGAMLCSLDHSPSVGRMLKATICWMDEQQPMLPGNVYRIKQTTRSAQALVSEIETRFDIASLTEEYAPPSLSLNEIGKVSIRISSPLVFDDYAANRNTGGFILIDESTNATVAAGMIGHPSFSFSNPLQAGHS